MASQPASQPAIPNDGFLTFTTLEEMTDSKARKVVASNASRYGREKRRRMVNIQPDSIVRSFLHWRHTAAPTRHGKLLLASNDQTEPPSPQSVLGKGNSDPFSVYPVRIGAEENEFIVFYRDVFLPAQYGMRLRVPKLAHSLTKDWEDCVRGLSDEGIAHGSLARWGHMVSKFNPEMLKATMEHHYRSTQLLKKKVEQGHNLQTMDNYLHINMLYSAETISGNVDGALAHGRMFRSMFEEAWTTGSLDYILLQWQFNNDIHTSTVFLVRPVFDVDQFLPMVYAPMKALLDSEIPPLDYANNNIDSSIEGSLVNLFSDTRKFWELLILRERQGKTDGGSSAFFIWSGSQELTFLGRFMNHYIDIKQQLNRPDLTEMLKNQLLVQKYLTLAAVYLMKSLNLNPVVLGVPIFDCRPLLLPTLRASLEESDALFEQSSGRKDKNARLWALYAGSMAEQAFPKPGYDPCRQWFNKSLAEHAIESGIYTWDSLKLVLQGFLYSDRIPPNGSLWFQKTIICTVEHLFTSFPVTQAS